MAHWVCCAGFGGPSGASEVALEHLECWFKAGTQAMFSKSGLASSEGPPFRL